LEKQAFHVKNDISVNLCPEAMKRLYASLLFFTWGNFRTPVAYRDLTVTTLCQTHGWLGSRILFLCSTYSRIQCVIYGSFAFHARSRPRLLLRNFLWLRHWSWKNDNCSTTYYTTGDEQQCRCVCVVSAQLNPSQRLKDITEWL